jgi:hypothetical protein
MRAMPSYRFYFLNDADHIIDSDWAACANDNSAIQRAEMLVEDHSRCRAIEVWQGTRRVCAVAPEPVA